MTTTANSRRRTALGLGLGVTPCTTIDQHGKHIRGNLQQIRRLRHESLLDLIRCAQATTRYWAHGYPGLLQLARDSATDPQGPRASSVGKSSLLLRFTDETFLSPDETSATIGVDFKVKVIERRNKRWKLSIWDTAGQERFRTLTSSYYRGAQGVILVYDITARDTFESLTSWIAELDTFAGTGSGAKEVVRMIVGNKTDREFSRVVSTAEGAAFAKAQNPPWLFMECSAKKGGEDVTGEDGLFSRVVDKIVETPSLYMKTSVGINSINKKGPPGQFPSGTVALDDAEESGGGWCAC